MNCRELLGAIAGAALANSAEKAIAGEHEHMEREGHLNRSANVTLPAAGEYAQIDTQLARSAMDALRQGKPVDRQATIERIRAHPENYAPPVFYVLSSVLFEGGEKDEAAFWFYAGQLRGRFDANRCADATARGAIDQLNDMFGTPINKYTFRDLDKLEALVLKVLEWDRTTHHNYDHRWINLHGMDAMRSSLLIEQENPQPLSLPEDRWEAIAETTRTKYLEDFKKVVEWKKTRKAVPE